MYLIHHELAPYHKRRYIKHDEISSNLYKSCKRFTIR